MLKDQTVQKTRPLLPGDFHTRLQCREDLAGTHCPDAKANPSDSAKVSSPRWEGGAARRDGGSRSPGVPGPAFPYPPTLHTLSGDAGQKRRHGHSLLREEQSEARGEEKRFSGLRDPSSLQPGS